MAKNRVLELPIKLKKTTIKERNFNYLVFLDVNGNTLLEQRKGKGIWQGLYQFPLLETNGSTTENELKTMALENLPDGNKASVVRFNSEPIVHKLSHQHLKTTFWIVEGNFKMEGGIPWSKVEEFPVPVLIADFIKRFKNHYF